MDDKELDGLVERLRDKSKGCPTCDGVDPKSCVRCRGQFPMWFWYVDKAADAILALRQRAEQAERLIYVPGLWRCAKCKCQMISTTINANSGLFKANKEPQQCPNDCGPMWRVTERDAGNEALDRLVRITAERDALRKDAEAYEKWVDNWSESLPDRAMFELQAALERK